MFSITDLVTTWLRLGFFLVLPAFPVQIQCISTVQVLGPVAQLITTAD